MTVIDHRSDIIAKLKAEGKVRVMNTPYDFTAIRAINKHMEEVRREFILKSIQSERDAEKIILTT